MRLITIYTILSPDNNELTRSNKADCKLQQFFFYLIHFRTSNDSNSCNPFTSVKFGTHEQYVSD